MGTSRQQMRWLALAFVLLLASDSFCQASASITHGVHEQHALHVMELWNTLSGHQSRMDENPGESGIGRLAGQGIPGLSEMLDKIHSTGYASQDEEDEAIEKVLGPLLDHGSTRDMDAFLEQTSHLTNDLPSAEFLSQLKFPDQSSNKLRGHSENLDDLTSLLQTGYGSMFRYRHPSSRPKPGHNRGPAPTAAQKQPGWWARKWRATKRYVSEKVDTVKGAYRNWKDDSKILKGLKSSSKTFREVLQGAFRCPAGKQPATIGSMALASGFGFLNGAFFGLLEGIRQGHRDLKNSEVCGIGGQRLSAAFNALMRRPGMLLKGVFSKEVRGEHTRGKWIRQVLGGMMDDFNLTLFALSHFLRTCSGLQKMLAPFVVMIVIGAIVTGILMLLPGIGWIAKLVIMLVSFIFGLPFLGSTFSQFWRNLVLCARGQCDIKVSTDLIEAGTAILGFIVVTVLVSGPDIVARVKGIRTLFKQVNLAKHLKLTFRSDIFGAYKNLNDLTKTMRTIIKGDPKVAAQFSNQLVKIAGNTPAVLIESVMQGLKAAQWRVPHSWLLDLHIRADAYEANEHDTMFERRRRRKRLEREMEEARQAAEALINAENSAMSTPTPPPMSTIPPREG